MLKSTLLIIGFIIVHNLCYSQLIKRQSIGTIGMHSSSNGLHVIQSVGQPFFTSGANNVNPGFIQTEKYFIYSESKDESFLVNNKVRMFPNPVESILTIEGVESDFVINCIKMYDVKGQLIRFIGGSDVNGSVNCMDLSPGVYLIWIFTEHSVIRNKIIKK